MKKFVSGTEFLKAWTNPGNGMENIDKNKNNKPFLYIP